MDHGEYVNESSVQKVQATPGIDNMGVANTDQLALSALVDWFSCTFTFFDDEKKIPEILGLNYDDFCKLEYGNKYYAKSMILGRITIYYEGRQSEANGIFVEMTGQACREFEAISKYDWREMMLRCLEYDVTFPRIDIAFDQIAYGEAKPYFTVPKMVRKMDNAEIVTRLKYGTPMRKVRLKDGANLGNTLYLGSPKSNVQIRFYEKHHERAAHKVEVDKNVSYWLRSEVQMRDEHAKSAVFSIVNRDTIDDIALGILNQMISVRVKDKNDSNRSRWDVCKWWTDFLNDAAKVPLSMQPAEPTIYQKKYYLEKQFSKTMAILFLAFGNDFDQFVRMVDEGMLKLKDKDVHEINRFIQMNELPMSPKTFEEVTKKIETNEKIRSLFGIAPNNIIEQLRLF